VGEGVLTKACRKKPKPRQFFLFNDLLVYGNIVINKKKYNKQHLIPLEEVKLKSLEDEGQFKNGWLICTRGKSFAVFAATATEKQEWMAHINKCIEDLLRKSGKKAVDEHAAVWVPDSEAGTCMHCKKVQFTLVNRRHHCRKCGVVCCNACSSKRFLLPAQSSKPLRVCMTCYDELSSQSADQSYNKVKRRPLKSNTDRTPPPRPPPPSREPSNGSGKTHEEEDILTEEEEDGEGEHSCLAASRVMANPKLYQLTSLGQSTGLWWDSFEEDLEELGIGDARSAQDSSGEEDSDEEEPNNSTHESNDPPSSFY